VLNWEASPPTFTKTRLRFVQDVVDHLLGTLQGVNLGVMRFNAKEGSPVVYPVSPVNSHRESLTFKGTNVFTTLFTTLTPGADSNSCSGSAGIGQNRIYRVSVLNGGPRVDKPADQKLPNDRDELLAQGDITPGVAMFFTGHDNDGDEPSGEEGIEPGPVEEDCYVGTEKVSCGGTDPFEVAYWFQTEMQSDLR
jgi:hypothetical protein